MFQKHLWSPPVLSLASRTVLRKHTEHMFMLTSQNALDPVKFWSQPPKGKAKSKVFNDEEKSMGSEKLIQGEQNDAPLK